MQIRVGDYSEMRSDPCAALGADYEAYATAEDYWRKKHPEHPEFPYVNGKPIVGYIEACIDAHRR